MSIPFFTPGDDPGPHFGELLRRVGMGPVAPTSSAPHEQQITPATTVVGHREAPGGGVGWGRVAPTSSAPHDLQITHATTVVAIRYADGVVMAGDRRATSGNWISHRTMEKVFPADRWSGVAIAGAAGPAMDMVKLFQLQLEHYEKVEGGSLSLEGKANQLAQMVRSNLPAAMQGFVVIPLFAGYDLRRQAGRLFQYDATGGRYEEADYATSGSGGMHAGTVIKIGFRDATDRDDTIDLALQALYTAADEDSATGGPDLVRRIFPVVATITAAGFERVPDSELGTRFQAIVDAQAVAGGTEGAPS